ncbi:hypothetical protein L0P88_07110 [Muricauda sp. SCSIO 64092]|uniref:WD40/YVTN/BNR-like repeat-containing protein n=1 Tax=Allomuricauda sp. SCSIO 64092 TaxID=2908842 RepID=UPI001FF1B333|nr:hypothetical protein [Muricauda sp. SCSIO 64092]UOY08316.1 hypothetical protein L0P88_07110 [Muricauda sp. SCSIO 64092]
MKKYIVLALAMAGCSCFGQQPEEKWERAFEFKNVGPSRGGRVTAVKGVIDSTNVYYMGSTGGGLWKTIDYGKHWKNISDGYFESPSIGAIAIFQKNPNILYVGTGSDGIRSNVIVGRGIYKSIDAGKTWEFSGLPNTGQIGALEVHPNNSKIAYAAVVGQPFKKSKERGVFKTMDGGKHWNKVLFHSDSVGAVDIELAPNRPEIVYATMWRARRKPWTIISGGATDGIYKSVDGGKNWKPLKKGLPTALTGKVDLAVSQAMPSRVWAQIQAAEGQEGIYKSDDYGESWEKVEMPAKVHKSVMYRPFYFTNIDANPQNADNIWAGTKKLWTSYNGGKKWKEIIPPHSDHHDLWINPRDSLFMIAGNDGGGAISIDGGKNWSTQFNQPTAELYSCNVDDQYPFYLYSGQQDNTTIRVPSRLPAQNVLNSNDGHGMENLVFWDRVGGCETGPAIPKPGDPNIVYSNCKGQFSVYNHKLGTEHLYYIGGESLYGNHPDDITYRFQRVTPMEVSPHDPNVVYYGSQYLHKTTDGGKNWERISGDLTENKPEYRMRSGGPIDEDISGEEYYAVLYAIQESPIKKGLIWTGSNDGLIHVTKDGGATWSNVTPSIPSGGRVQHLEASPHDPAKCYAAINRDYLGDEQTYFLKTEDYGNTWQRTDQGISKGHVARVLREDPDREGLLYAGTEFGLYLSFDDGAHWQSFQRNLPIVPVTDIQVFRKNLVLSTLGRSFWVLEDISPLHHYGPEERPKLHVFQPKPNHESNQNIYFTLPEKVTDTMVKFQFSKDGQPVHTKELKVTRLPKDELGIRRTEWDFRWYFKRKGEKDFLGPRVSPGEYDLKIFFGQDSVRTTIHYGLHPELKESGVTLKDLQEQEKLSLKVTQLYLSIAHKVKMLEEQLEEATNKKRKEGLRKRLTLLKKGPKRYDRPMLLDHVKYLMEMCSEEQQPLGRDAFDRFRQLQSEWERIQ